ncbi:MAG: hypothetical protein WCQ21_29020 [Verrucomicrobiota bacterium]
MRKCLDKLVRWIDLRAIASSEVARFDGIGLVHLRWRDDSRELFRETMLAALRLIQERDSRRYATVQQHLKWIINRVSNTIGAGYDHTIHACNLELQDLRQISYEIHVAFHACIVVHEATHGVIAARGVPYEGKNRVRVERLCTAEQNRFAARLSAHDPEHYPARLLQLDFDEEPWHAEWTMTKKEWLRAFMRHWWADTRAEPQRGADGSQPPAPATIPGSPAAGSRRSR